MQGALQTRRVHAVVLATTLPCLRPCLKQALPALRDSWLKTAAEDAKLAAEAALVTSWTARDPENGGEKHSVELRLASDVSAEALDHVLSFCYSGDPDLPTAQSQQPDQPNTPTQAQEGGEQAASAAVVAQVKALAARCGLGELVTWCDNLGQDLAFLNPSIATWVSDVRGAELGRTFLGQPMCADSAFIVNGERIPAHRVLLCCRSEVFSSLLSGKFAECSSGEVRIEDASVDSFKALLEYLYTDHCDVENSDMCELLVLADKYACPRLVALCELYISKAIEVATEESVKDSNQCDLVGLAHMTAATNAPQLHEFCVHFMAVNFEPFSQRDDFDTLDADIKSQVETRRYPPLSFYAEMDAFQKRQEAKAAAQGGVSAAPASRWSSVWGALKSFRTGGGASTAAAGAGGAADATPTPTASAAASGGDETSLSEPSSALAAAEDTSPAPVAVSVA